VVTTMTMIEEAPNRVQITRGFAIPESAGEATDKWSAARDQLQNAHFSLVSTLAAVIESCPEAIDAEITNRLAGAALKARREALARQRAE
jgi:hypothetical protein